MIHVGVPIERVVVRPRDPAVWPATIPAVRQLIEHGWDLAPGINVIVGENGSGKSTIVEALAGAWGRDALRHKKKGPKASLAGSTQRSYEDSDLADSIELHGTFRGSLGGFFLRAEALHTFLRNVDANPNWRAQFVGPGEWTQTRSHGESFLNVLNTQTQEPGLYLFDEPESALSFQSCLALLSLMKDLVEEGSQIVLATHSPLLAAAPGAVINEFGEWGVRRTEWADLDLVRNWRNFLADPERYLRLM